MSKDNEYFTIVSHLANGMTVEYIAKEEGIAKSKIIRIKREYDTAVANNDMASLTEIDNAMLGELVEQIKTSTPEGLQETVGESLAKIEAAASSLEVLQDDFVATAKQFSQKLRVLLPQIQNASDLQILATVLCRMQEAFFNKNTTQVNVQNNYGQESKYQEFLND